MQPHGQNRCLEVLPQVRPHRTQNLRAEHSQELHPDPQVHIHAAPSAPSTWLYWERGAEKPCHEEQAGEQGSQLPPCKLSSHICPEPATESQNGSGWWHRDYGAQLPALLWAAQGPSMVMSLLGNGAPTALGSLNMVVQNQQESQHHPHTKSAPLQATSSQGELGSALYPAQVLS